MDIEQAIRAEQASYIHRNLPTAVIGSLVVSGLVVGVFWQEASTVYLLAWLGAFFVLVVPRAIEWQRYRTTDFATVDSQRWLRRITQTAFISGCVWGAGWFFLFLGQSLIYQLLFCLTITMMAIAAMFTYGVHYKTFLSFVIPMMFPTVIALPLQSSRQQIAITSGVLLLTIVVLRSVNTFNRSFNTAMRLRFENAELVTQLTHEREAAEAANLAKSRFLAAASHDLRQPMHALNLYLGAVSNASLPTATAALLSKVSLCAQTMDEMFRALLDISKLDAGAVPVDIHEFELQPILQRICNELEPLARDKGIELRLVYCNVIVSSDPILVERIARNLIGNAVNHTERGKILVGCRRHKQRTAVWVCDTGPGIAVEQQRLIFEEFYQVGNRGRDRSKGLGLGLAIVSRLTKLLNTAIKLSSTEGRGSVFSFELPCSSYQTIISMEKPPTAQQRDFTNMLAVIVDDEELILDSTKTLLESWGCQVVAAVSGAAAIQLLTQSNRPPDVLVCDYRLQNDENGIDVINALRSEFNITIPALLITGDTAREQLLQIDASNLPVLHKPVRETELNEAMARLLFS
jgi:two-component system, sensor histidine kinase